MCLLELDGSNLDDLEARSNSVLNRLAKPAGVCCAGVAASKPNGVSLSSTDGWLAMRFQLSDARMSASGMPKYVSIA